MKFSGFLGNGPLRLEQLHVGHATDRYLSWMNDLEVTRFLETRFSPPTDIAALEAFIQSCEDSPTDLLLGMFLNETGQHIGNIKLGPVNFHHKTGEVGLLIGERSCWGKGYAAAAIAILAEHAFATLGLIKLTAGCYAENVGSTRAFQRAGFQIEGRRVMQWDCDGQRQDGILLGRVNPEACS